MKPKTAELLAQLRELTQGFAFPISESDYWVKPFVWEVERQGEFTLEKFLRSETPNYSYYRSGGQIMQPLSVEDFWQSCLHSAQQNPGIIQQYELFRELLQTYLVHLEAAKIRTLNDPKDSFLILLGTTQSGEWVGISPDVYSEFQQWEGGDIITQGEPLLTPELPQTKLTKELLTQLEPILPHLEMGEPQTWYLLKGFIGRVGSNRESMLTSLLDSIGFARTVPFCQFAYFDEYDEIEDIETRERLDQFLTSNLSNLRTYLFGICTCYHIYTMGQTSDGDWVGVSSIAVWS